jgi:arsenite-transporting ATPase
LNEALTTARVVVTPERVVVAEAQRTLSYLALYGYPVDAVLVNRVPGRELRAIAQSAWLDRQREQIEAIDRTFAPLPCLTASLSLEEPIGLELISALGRELYAERDPLDRMSSGQALHIATSGDQSTVRMPVPGVDRDDIRLDRLGDELVVTLGAYRRTVRLPDGLRWQEVVRAGVAGNHLEIVFGEGSRVG